MEFATELGSSPNYEGPAMLFIIDEHGKLRMWFRNKVADPKFNEWNSGMALILHHLIRRAHFPGIRGLEVPQTFYLTVPSDRTLAEVMVDFANRNGGGMSEGSWKQCPFSINFGLGVTDKAIDRNTAMEKVAAWEHRKPFADEYLQEYCKLISKEVYGYGETLSQEMQNTIKKAAEYWGGEKNDRSADR